MLLSLALLFLPAPQAHVAALTGGNDKPAVVEIDTPSLASVKGFEPRPPDAILPARLDLRVAESSSAATMAPGQPLRPGLHPSETVANRRLWYALAISSHSAATFDAWSTRRAVSSGQGRESKPPALWTTRRTSDRKSTRLNSSHVRISYAVFCLKKKKE